MRKKMWVEFCDNPTCEAPQVATADLPIPGIRLGAGSWDDSSGGGPIPALYVCSIDCVVPALLDAMRNE